MIRTPNESSAKANNRTSTDHVRMLRNFLLVVVAPLALGVVAALAVLLAAPGRDQIESPAPVGSGAAPGAATTAPAAEVEKIHVALHDIAARCRAEVGSQPEQALDADTEVILAFAERYPEARFAIDDESGTSLSLLMVTREALRTCAPAAAARVDQELPLEFREDMEPPS